MNISLLNILKTVSWDFRRDMAQTYANALKNAIELHIGNDVEKKEGFFLSKKGTKQMAGNFEDKLYFGNIHNIERHLYYNDEELAEDDQIINVVVVDGPVTRDGGGCSYGTKDYRDQVMYANMVPQVIGHVFIVNTPGGETACRNDYEMMFNDCREKGKPTVAFVDGMCCSSGVNLASRCDRVIVMNPKDDFGCIGSMAAFWATPDGAVDQDGTRYIEIVGDDSPEKNDWYREAAQGDYEKLREIINKDTQEFHQTVRENRPLVEDWMLTGKVFEAQEVIPALVDEIGTLDRAIECIFELANETLTAARLVTAPVPEEEKPEEQPDDDQPEDAATELPTNSTELPTNSVELPTNSKTGISEQDTSTPKNNTDMTDEEKKAAEVAEQPAATQEETPATEQPAEEAAPATEAPAVSEETPAQEPAQEPAEEPAAEPAQEETPAEEAPATEEEKPAEEPASEEAVAQATEDIDKVQETLHTAESMIAEKDQQIADMQSIIDTKSETISTMQENFDQQSKNLADAQALIAERDATIAARDKSIEEKDALIETLKKQVGDLKAEVKELAGKPAPMTNADSGVPQDNGTGEAPKTHQKRITRENMTYEHCREVAKEGK